MDWLTRGNNASYLFVWLPFALLAAIVLALGYVKVVEPRLRGRVPEPAMMAALVGWGMLAAISLGFIYFVGALLWAILSGPPH